ncbi:carboxymuconolactone decarboxylase family protein [Candidatus Ruminimicrobium bovinum]|uniref:carboxymuconolactone decarboxylase family protein n=1 Tax=Candidatus Ruminimicrobium bovinum TaxID=3242779 RepID=UPI0039B829FE
MKKLKFLTLVISAVLLFGGTIMAEDTLSLKQQNIATISMYTASADLKNLEIAVKKGLEDGLTINEIKEVMVQLYAYCGFPKSLNALGTLLKVTKEGTYTEGPAGKPLSKKANKNKIGTKTQTELVGSPVKGELFEFAPAIDDYLKEHLFGDIFARGILTNQEREIATIAALSSIEGVEPQLKSHIQCGKNTGLTNKQISAILIITSKPKTEIFAIGEPNPFSKYFIGQSYLNILTKEQVFTANVTFEPACRNNWHIHHKGGQILLCTGGRGWYQQWGKPAQELKKGDVVNIAPETKHWHGAAKDSWFSHVAIEVPSDGGSTEWCEEVSDEEYNKLP